jgi:hypothetical protein
MPRLAADGCAIRFLREKQGGPALAEFDDATAEIRVARDDVLVLLDLGHEALIQQVMDEGAELFGFAGVELEGLGQLLDPHGAVIGLPQQFEQAVFQAWAGGGASRLARRKVGFFGTTHENFEKEKYRV